MNSPHFCELRVHSFDATGKTVLTLIQAKAQSPLARSLWLSGQIEPKPLCGGLGRCGRCRVQYLESAPQALPEEEAILGKEQVAAGWRLACRRQVPDTACLDLLLPQDTTQAKKAAPVLRDAANTEQSYVLALDLGTTSLAWQCLDAQGTVIASGSDLNPQAGAGSDVMSRLACALEEGEQARLAQCIWQYVQTLVTALAVPIKTIVIAGNTVMTDILLEKDLHGLAAAPYRLSHHGDSTLAYGESTVYIPPLAAPFVGADITAGLAYLLEQTPKPFLLADLGTNGEMALVSEKGVFLTSIPLGPALEGIGMDCGRLADRFAITQFTLGPLGLVGHLIDGKTTLEQALGISATGYLSLLAVLLKLGCMDRQGHFVLQPTMPLARRIAKQFDLGYAVPRLSLTKTLWLSASDIEDILKIKAAFSVAFTTLLAAAKLEARDLAQIAIAGALGSFVDATVLETLGFIPHGTCGMVRAVGNTSLAGAAFLALQPQKRAELATLCRQAIVLTPAADPLFHTNYLAAMHFGE